MLFNMTRTWKDSIQQAEILSYGYGTLIQKKLISNEIALPVISARLVEAENFDWRQSKFSASTSIAETALPVVCLNMNAVHIAFLVKSVHWIFDVVRLDCSTSDLLWTDSLHIRVVKLLHGVDIYISPNGSEIIHYICLSETCGD